MQGSCLQLRIAASACRAKPVLAGCGVPLLQQCLCLELTSRVLLGMYFEKFKIEGSVQD